MATILLLGLESDMEDQLARVLRKIEHDVQMADSVESGLQHNGIDVIFAGGDGPDYREIIRRLAWRRPEVPVVLVSRIPDNTRWLDALELGAADYCGAPFEPMQVRWVVDSVLRRSPVIATIAA